MPAALVAALAAAVQAPAANATTNAATASTAARTTASTKAPDKAPSTRAQSTSSGYGITVQRNLELKLRDGRVLRADVHMPTDPATGRPASGRFPVIVGFTPYGKTPSAAVGLSGFGGFNPDLVKHGYIGLMVDVPGTGGSTGKFDLFSPAEAKAGAEVVRWAARLPHSSGKVGMLGLSYVAIDQLFAAAEVGPHSPLKAIFPMAATIDPYRDLFTSGGALNVESPLGLVFGYGVTRVFTPFIEMAHDPAAALRLAYQNLLQAGPFELTFARDMLTNGARRYDNDYWKRRAPERILPKIVKNGVAVYLVGGLYDVFQSGEPLLYSGLQNAAAGRPVGAPMPKNAKASAKYQLLYGPWTHTSMGKDVDMTKLQLQWFDHWLKGRDTGITKTATPLHVKEPGGGSYDSAAYPPANAKPVHLSLRSGGRLTNEGPGAAEPADKISYNLLSNPCTRSTDQFAAGLLSQFVSACTDAQHKNDKDTLTYATAPLTRPMRLSGPIGVTLNATSNRPESQWSLTLEDVAPDGTSTDISGGAQLGSLRAVDAKRSWKGTPGNWIMPYHPLTKASGQKVPVGTPVRYDIQIRPAFTTLAAGHRLRLRVGTADFPHLIPLADLPQLLGGQYTVQHDPQRPSGIDLSVIGAP
ncbi:CocE/NonD family hydrolase [Actinomadura barringtoniae]|uniref:CocE/NonD family hydrolase n=2 Tax=Actinomadura barringtoniae TaxID=1427535 RepID=A0A939PV81_9ACTN|nr:CocE/NonD family hydrolase [Actinomadura barringtoniae]